MANVPINNITDTWNSSGTNFTGIKFNVTDTASAAGSLLMDLQVGGVSKVTVGKSGFLLAQNLYAVNDVAFGNEQNCGMVREGNYFSLKANYSKEAYISGGVRVRSDGSIKWSTTTNPVTGSDSVIISRDADNTLAQRNGANAQTFRLYRTYDGTNNGYTAALQDATTGYILDSVNAGTVAAPTNLLDLRLNGASKLKITKEGNIQGGHTSPDWYAKFYPSVSYSPSAFVSSVLNGGIAAVGPGGTVELGGNVPGNGSQSAALTTTGLTFPGRFVSTTPPLVTVVNAHDAGTIATIELIVKGQRATGTTNIVGGNLQIEGGNGSPTATGNGNGGQLYLRGGTGTGTGRNGYIIMDNLPTSNPAVAGALWNNAGVLSVSAG